MQAVKVREQAKQMYVAGRRKGRLRLHLNSGRKKTKQSTKEQTQHENRNGTTRTQKKKKKKGCAITLIWWLDTSLREGERVEEGGKCRIALRQPRHPLSFDGNFLREKPRMSHENSQCGSAKSAETQGPVASRHPLVSCPAPVVCIRPKHEKKHPGKIRGQRKGGTYVRQRAIYLDRWLLHPSLILAFSS